MVINFALQAYDEMFDYFASLADYLVVVAVPDFAQLDELADKFFRDVCEDFGSLECPF